MTFGSYKSIQLITYFSNSSVVVLITSLSFSSLSRNSGR
nr:MAG TPA: hypothetical protein [Caudoviricetes sp.]DAW32155.1 MAG TPA: hypothetical protein [Caudoviricetes sp.]